MEQKNKKRITLIMGVIYAVLTVFAGIGILANMISIQFVHGEEWRERGEKRESSLHTDPARRGNIYSSDGKLLATTTTVCDLYLDLGSRWAVKDSIYDSTVAIICRILGDAVPQHDSAYFRRKIDHAKEQHMQCALIQRRIPYSTWRELFGIDGWKNTIVKTVDSKSVVSQMREHIYGNLAENTIGFRNSFETGTFTGLEGKYDSILRGQDGKFNQRRLTRGTWLPVEPSDNMTVVKRTDNDTVDTIMLKRRIDGNHIISTIDTRYQDIAESSLRKALWNYGGQSGCAILMEMQTGYVLACANLSIDTARHDYREMPDNNIAVSHRNEPGSTFKTVILTAMMSDPTMKIDTTMKFRVGYKNFGGKDNEINDDHTLPGRDSLSLREVIEQSSNVGMCELGWKYYRDRRDTLRYYVEKVFPYEMLRLDVRAPEPRSRINNLNQSNRDFLNFCYGYSTAVSPMQVLTFYNAVGANGRMVKPLFCRGVMENGKVREIKPIVLNEKIASAETLRIIREMLEGVVENGTGNNIKNNTYGIAGKTGTAFHNYANHKRYNASFAGFFPAENPRYSCLVVLEDVPNYGRQAAIVFKSISDCVVAMEKKLSEGGVKSAWPTLKTDSVLSAQKPIVPRGSQADLMKQYKRFKIPYLSADSSSQWVAYRQATDSTRAQYYPYEPTGGRTPNCLGMTARDAIRILHENGLKVKMSGYGRVSSQAPSAGKAIKRGATVVIKLNP